VCDSGLVAPKLITRCMTLGGVSSILNKRGEVSYRYNRFENVGKSFPFERQFTLYVLIL
jgi:hypothetical protein